MHVYIVLSIVATETFVTYFSLNTFVVLSNPTQTMVGMPFVRQKKMPRNKVFFYTRNLTHCVNKSFQILIGQEQAHMHDTVSSARSVKKKLKWPLP